MIDGRWQKAGAEAPRVEDLLAQRGITVSCQAIRHWCLTFGPEYARTVRRRRGRMGGTWYLDELFVMISGRRPVAVRSAAARVFRTLLKGQDREPRRLISDHG